jgi:hypothetical protein
MIRIKHQIYDLIRTRQDANIAIAGYFNNYIEEMKVFAKKHLLQQVVPDGAFTNYRRNQLDNIFTNGVIEGYSLAQSNISDHLMISTTIRF